MTKPANQPGDGTGDTSKLAGLSPQLIDHIEVELEAIIGATRLSIERLADLAQGAVLPLDATLDRAVELRLNGVVVARGELVAAGDRFGVRITETAA